VIVPPRRSVSVGVFVVCLAATLFLVARQPAQMPGRFSIIVDTDAGTDDLVALSYLLSRTDVDIQVITTVNGIAHADAGARNILRLLRVANRRLDVFVGADQPLEGRDAFPADWRRAADDMTTLRATTGRRPRSDAVSAILARLRAAQTPVTLLALGPLTNIAAALQREPRTLARISQLVIMGGAIDVPGNAPADASAPVAEWNMYIDPTAASLIFKSGLPITLVPLDATNRVPIDRSFLASPGSGRRSPLATTAADLLADQQAMIESGSYFAWDPLAAVAAIEPGVVRTREQAIEVVRTGDERGRLRVRDAEPNADVAYDAVPAAFRRLFVAALTRKSE
jgi:inosine-uridine nucleoside N-ribohydrolase